MNLTDELLKIRWQVRFTKCNLKCPYCIAEWTKRKVEFDSEKFFKIIENLKKINKRLLIRIGVEGEFFLSKDLQEGVIELSRSENVVGVSFSTNLQEDYKKIDEFLDRVNIEKVGMGCTLHDTVISSVEDFFEKVKKISERGVLLYVGYVSIPERFDYIKKYKEILDEIGIPFILNEMSGNHNGRRLPYDYTEEEKRFLKDTFFSEHYFKMLVLRESPKGKECGAGYNYFYVDHNGDVYNCGVDKNPRWTLKEKILFKLNRKWAEKIRNERINGNKIGNLIEGRILLNEKYRICPHNECACGNEVQAMKIIDENYIRTRTLRIIYPKEKKDFYERKYKNLKAI